MSERVPAEAFSPGSYILEEIVYRFAKLANIGPDRMQEIIDGGVMTSDEIGKINLAFGTRNRRMWEIHNEQWGNHLATILIEPSQGENPQP